MTIKPGLARRMEPCRAAAVDCQFDNPPGQPPHTIFRAGSSMVEHETLTLEVAGSSPALSSTTAGRLLGSDAGGITLSRWRKLAGLLLRRSPALFERNGRCLT
jgi:hypothetical protein